LVNLNLTLSEIERESKLVFDRCKYSMQLIQDTLKNVSHSVVGLTLTIHTQTHEQIEKLVDFLHSEGIIVDVVGNNVLFKCSY